MERKAAGGQFQQPLYGAQQNYWHVQVAPCEEIRPRKGNRIWHSRANQPLITLPHPLQLIPTSTLHRLVVSLHAVVKASLQLGLAGWCRPFVSATILHAAAMALQNLCDSKHTHHTSLGLGHYGPYGN